MYHTYSVHQMSINALYFTPFAEGDITTNKWRLAIKTNGSIPTVFTAFLVFQIDTTAFFTSSQAGSDYMVFFHAATADHLGLGVFFKYDGPNLQIGCRYIVKNGTEWIEVPNSFTTLSSYGDLTTDPFMVRFCYSDLGSGNYDIELDVVMFASATPKTSPDASSSETLAGIEIVFGNQWGYGSAPITNTSEYGYISDNGYNSYVSAGIYLTYLQAWDTEILQTTTGTNYGMFNSDTPSYSLYDLMRSITMVPYDAPNLTFQLNIPDTAVADLGLLDDIAINTPPTLVTLTSISTGYPPLPDFAVNDSTSIVATEDTLNCLLASTLILTPKGYQCIEFLVEGDWVTTGDRRHVQICKTQRTVCKHTNKTHPSLIKRGKYGALKDLYLSQGHAFLLQGCEFIYPFDKESDVFLAPYSSSMYIYHQLMLENYFTDTLVANGVIVESWTGPVNKHFFDAGGPHDTILRHHLNQNGRRELRKWVSNRIHNSIVPIEDEPIQRPLQDEQSIK